MKTKLIAAKIGSNIINDSELLESFLTDFARIAHPKILIHGGGKKATGLNAKLGVPTTMHEGRRITSSDVLEGVIMTYAGTVNKTIVSSLQAKGCNALGLSGADANCILAKKRPPAPIDYGWVGDIVAVNAPVIGQLLRIGLVPVFAALTHDGQGHMLNTNADTIASEVAIALNSQYNTALVYCFDKPGVLADREDDTSVIPRIDRSQYEKLKQNNVIDKGMIPKINTGFHALLSGVGDVIIGNAKAILEDSNLHTTLIV